MTMQMELAEQRWTDAMRRGATWLFGVTLVSAFLVNGIAFALPFIGGTRSDLMWIAIIPAVAGLGIVYAVFLLTMTEPGAARALSDRGTLLRILVAIDALAQFATPFSMALASPGSTYYFGVGKNLFQLGFAYVFFLYLKLLSNRFGLERLARTAGTLAWLFPAASLALPLASDVLPAAINPVHLVYSTFDMVLNLIVGIWALRLIWRFGSSVTSATRGRCLRCGYFLSDLSSIVARNAERRFLPRGLLRFRARPGSAFRSASLVT